MVYTLMVFIWSNSKDDLLIEAIKFWIISTAMEEDNKIGINKQLESETSPGPIGMTRQ